ncbi:MAG: hypothetical protein ACLS4Z_05360 [Christensenellaceae bacterium]
MKTDVVIVGAGPAGIFTAIEMLRKDSTKKIVIVEKGKSVENRHCPKAKTQKCMNCKPYCHITTGFSGAGAFSDGKLSLSSEVGGDLPMLIGETLAQDTIDYTDKIYLEFGADEHIEGLNVGEEVKEIRKRAIQRVEACRCPIRHVGWKRRRASIFHRKYLQNHGVEIFFDYECNTPARDGYARAFPSPKRTAVRHGYLAEDTVVAGAAAPIGWKAYEKTAWNTSPAPSISAFGG